MRKTGRRKLLKYLMLAGSVIQIPAIAEISPSRSFDNEIIFSAAGLNLKISTQNGA